MWKDVALIIPQGMNIQLSDPMSYQILGDQQIAQRIQSKHEVLSLLQNLGTDDQILFFEYSGTVYNTIVEDLTALLFYSSGLEIILLMGPGINFDPSWIIHTYFKLRERGGDINFDLITQNRYEYLFFTSLRAEFEASLDYDLFATYPETKFSKALNKQQDPIGKTMTQFDLDSIEHIIQEIERLFGHLSLLPDDRNAVIIEVILEVTDHLKKFSDQLQNELWLITLNVFTSLFKAYQSPNIQKKMREFSEMIIKETDVLGLSSIKKVVKLFSNWYLKTEENTANISWTNGAIPRQLQLLPVLRQIESVTDISSDNLQIYVELNFKALSDPIPYVAMEEFQDHLGKLHLRFNDYSNATQYFEYAAKLYEEKGYHVLSREAKAEALTAQSEHYMELSVAANLFHYNGRSIESSTMAWSALSTALNLIRDSTRLEIDSRETLASIINFFPRVRRPLVADKENEMTQVIELKLDELFNFMNSLSDNGFSKEEILQMVDMHIDSVRFLKPAKPPRFMLMTLDGRLIDTQEAVEIPDEVSDATLNHLIAGALTAIRSILQEATQSSGFVKEINAGDAILLMEARQNHVVVCSATTVSDNLRKIVNDLADSIQEKFGDRIENWFGDSESMIPVKELIRDKIKEELL